MSGPVVEGRQLIGVVRYTGGLGPFESVQRVWDQSLRALRAHFDVVTHETDDADLSQSREVAQMLDAVELLVLLLPYHRLPCHRRVPLLLFALGSLQKGAAWMARHRADLRTTDTIVVNSTSCREIFLDLARGPAMAVPLLPLGIDLKTFRPLGAATPGSTGEAVRRALGIPARAKVLVYAGRMSLQKNVQLLATVVDEVRRRGVDAHLLLAGAFDDFVIPELTSSPAPDIAREFRVLVADRRLGPHITLTGHVEPRSLAELMSAGDVGINLTTFGNENFGLGPVEQQACGLPVVGSDWGGLRDTIRHGETGMRVPTLVSDLGPRVHFEGAIDHVVALLQDDDQRARLGASAAGHAARFSLVAFEEALAAIVRDAINRPTSVVSLVPGFDPVWLLAVDRSTPPEAELPWAHLHPVEEPGLYRRLLAHCSTMTASDVDWLQARQVAKAFSWWFDERGRLCSADARWKASFERAGVAIDGDELALLRAVGGGCRAVDGLRALFPDADVLGCLAALTGKGLVLPRWSLPRALAARRVRRP